MNLDNKYISSRQFFRMGVLENITLGMVVIPYITVNLAGRWHFLAFLLGLVFCGIYMGIIYFLSAKGDRSCGSIGGILYTFRFLIRGGLILLFFGKTIQEFLLQSYNLWIIVIAFALICGYGASRDIEKRGRMLELLFPWMIVPIILVAVFSLSSINLEELYRGLMGINYDMLHIGAGAGDVFLAAYVAFLVTTSVELSLFTIPYEKEHNWRPVVKTGVWIFISIILAYVFIIAILGGHWVASDSQAALNVMEAAFVPGEVFERADYPVLAFWIIGVFALLSGYMHFAKEALVAVNKRRGKRSRLGIWIVIAGVVVMSYIWTVKPVDIYLAKYMLYADVIISLIVPLLPIIKRHSLEINNSTRLFGKKAGLIVCIIIASFFVEGCTSCGYEPLSKKQVSIEERDYVTEINFKGNDEIIFTIADIKKYLSEGTGDFETTKKSYKADSIQQVMDNYYEENGRQLDVGHLENIDFDQVSEEKIRRYAIEMSDITALGKSVTVTIEPEDEEKYAMPLRQLIKLSYSGENFQ